MTFKEYYNRIDEIVKKAWEEVIKENENIKYDHMFIQSQDEEKRIQGDPHQIQ